MLLVEFERRHASRRRRRGAVASLAVARVHLSAELIDPGVRRGRGGDLLRAFGPPPCPRCTPAAAAGGPLAFVEDIGVAPDTLPDFITRAKAILKRADLTASFQIHVPTGQVHLRPFADLDDADDAAMLWPLAEELHGLAISLGGTVSAQHGTGIARTPWVVAAVRAAFPGLSRAEAPIRPARNFEPRQDRRPRPEPAAWPLRPSGPLSAAECHCPMNRLKGPDREVDTVAALGDKGLSDCRFRLQRLRRVPNEDAAQADVPHVSGRRTPNWPPPRGQRRTCFAPCSTCDRPSASDEATCESWPTCVSTARCARPSAPARRISRS